MVGAGRGWPSVASSFIGRRAELVEGRERLARGRLVTLTGAGGSGKTRLAMELACDRLDDYPGGAWLLDLTTVGDPALVTDALAETLGIASLTTRDPIPALVGRLGSRPSLVVLDNCEHVLGACAALAHAILSASPVTRVLATSRQPLSVPAESVWRVPPLTLAEAVTLFGERAREAGALDEGSDEVVREICRRLDGMPLAIELAAARSRAMTTAEILSRLDDRFRLLRGESSVLHPRQQTLRATIEWSYDLLTPAESALSDRLSVFAGGFGIEAAEQVCAAADGSTDDIAGRVVRLVDRSLLVPEVGAEGRTRYRQLETVREYARQRLSDLTGSDELQRRHAHYFAEVAERAGPELVRGEVGRWVRTLARDADDLRTALDWCHRHEPAMEQRVAVALTWFWHWRGSIGEGRRRMAGVLSNFPDATMESARTLVAMAWLAFRESDYPAARAALEEALAIQRRIGRRGGVGQAQRELGTVLVYEGRVEEALPLLDAALDSARGSGEPSAVAAALFARASVPFDLPACRHMLEESVAIRRRLGQLWPMALPLSALAAVLVPLGELDLAERALDGALGVFRDVGDRWGLGLALIAASAIAFERGQRHRAAILKGAAVAICRDAGSDLPPAHRQYPLGVEEADPGDLVLDLDGLVAFATAGRLRTTAARPPLAPVSRRESEVARLVAKGLGNREIAASLHLSERTVETHVQHILNKLGFRSRTQIAAWIGSREASSR